MEGTLLQPPAHAKRGNAGKHDPRTSMGADKMDIVHIALFIPCTCAITKFPLNIVRHDLHSSGSVGEAMRKFGRTTMRIRQVLCNFGKVRYSAQSQNVKVACGMLCGRFTTAKRLKLESGSRTAGAHQRIAGMLTKRPSIVGSKAGQIPPAAAHRH
jgi:hypothetical protein